MLEDKLSFLPSFLPSSITKTPTTKTQKMAVLAPSSHILCRDLLQRDQQHHPSNGGGCSSVTVQSSALVWEKTRRRRRRWLRGGGEVKAMGFWQGLTRPSSMEMEPISCMEDLDRALQKSQELSRPILIDWMASWCRKCIYLKPKLEKLAAELHPRIKFYCVDVNNVPQALVKRGNITKMPTIQLWKDGEWKAEIIGGHKAWLVMDEVREMIQKYL